MYLRKWLFIIFFLLAASVSFAQDSIALSQIISAEKLFGLEFTASKRDSIVSGAADNLRFYRYLHQNVISNDVPLPLWFDPVLPGKHFNHRQLSIEWSIPDNVILPRNIEELAFYSIPQLASLIRSKKISSVALTRFYLERLKKYGTTLHCVIELTENLALKRAAKADADLAKGVYKSPLQGIPYGLKDLFAVKGTHTTWGTPPYKDQIINENCFVEKQLEK